MNDHKNDALLLFQFGPVQEFIAQAAELSDLWAGSYLLSRLAWEGLKNAIPAYQESVIFPCFRHEGNEKPPAERALEAGIPCLPNRFLAWVPRDKSRDIAANVKKAMEDCLKKAMEDCLREGCKAAALPAGWETQVAQFLQTSWAILPDPTGIMGENYKELGKRLAMRRNVREFLPWTETAKTGPKDFLSGKETALENGRGAMNLLKFKQRQKIPACLKEKQTSVDEKPYIAVIAMDGDKMGEELSRLTTEEEHRRFSEKLVRFASTVREVPRHGVKAGDLGGVRFARTVWEVVEEQSGFLVYAGGDDVLAVVPAKQAVACAEELQQAFRDTVGQNLSASAGIAIGHKSIPLQDLVQKAHEAEKRAKNGYGRNALALSVFKRSGEILHWGCQWQSDNQTSKALDCFKAFSEHLKKQKEQKTATAPEGLSGRFPYKLAAVLQPYGEIDKTQKIMCQLLKAEFDIAWKQSWSQEPKEDGLKLKKTCHEYLDEIFDPENDAWAKTKDFLALFLCATFIFRDREDD